MLFRLRALQLVQRGGGLFRADRSGNVAIVFSLLCTLMVGAVAAAIEYSRAAYVRATLQATLDATTLALSKKAAFESAAQLQSDAQALFDAQFVTTGIANPTITATYTPATGSGTSATLAVAGDVAMPTPILGILGMDSIDIQASSTTSWGMMRLRVALVLDNSASMQSSGAMPALQAAALNLISQLQSAAANNGDIYVSVIPYAKVVNVGTSNYASSWINWASWIASNPGMSSASWDGSIMDRDQNYDVSNTAPIDCPTQFPAGQGASGDPTPATLVPLTYDWAGLSSEINQMTAAGGTNQPIGLVSGWQSLTQGMPFNAPAETPGYNYQHIIVLVAGGSNTEDRWYGDGVDPAPQVDAREQLLCSNIQAANITIYTVQLAANGQSASPVLQSCASDASKYFMLTSVGSLGPVFQQIAFNLLNLRLTQ